MLPHNLFPVYFSGIIVITPVLFMIYLTLLFFPLSLAKGLSILWTLSNQLLVFFSLKNIYLYLEQGREVEREGEKHQCVVASYTRPRGIWPTTQACALTGNWTGNPWVHRPALNPLSHTSQGKMFIFYYTKVRSLHFHGFYHQDPPGSHSEEQTMISSWL